MYLEINGNFFLSGPVPPGWGANSSGSSMARLQALLAAGCNLTQSLPAAWAQNLPALGALDVSMNHITGGSFLTPLARLYAPATFCQIAHVSLCITHFSAYDPYAMHDNCVTDLFLLAPPEHLKVGVQARCLLSGGP